MDALARKYRPKNIDEYLGEGVKEIVKRRFNSSEKYPNVVLLHGTHGCGKTSCARLLAMEYLCEHKVDGHACGKCEMCQELLDKLISSEAGVDVMGVREIDIASEGSKGTSDEIINDSLIEPVLVPYKILIMDEFHMASKTVQNRLLKIMEEPPKHLVFILCTTDPDKIIDTIHSRCQLKIEVKKAKLNDLANRMMYICEQEGIKTSMKALRLIAQKSDRIPRDSLMMLEQVASNHGNEVTLETVSAEMNDIANELYIEYFMSANTSLESIMQFTKKLKDDERDYGYTKFIKGLMQFTIDAVNIVYGIGLEEYPPEYVKSIAELMKIYSNSDLDYLLQIIEFASENMNAGDEKALLTIITTALRIGKIGQLESLQDIELERVRDNRKAKRNRGKVVKADTRKSTKTSAEALGMGVIGEVFGHGITEIVPGEDSKKVNIPFDDSQEQDNEVVSDSDIEDFLGDLLDNSD